MLNLKSASFIVIMLSQEGLPHVHLQKKPRLHFGESFTLRFCLRLEQAHCQAGASRAAWAT